MVRLFRKSDADLLAAVLEERDRLEADLATERVASSNLRASNDWLKEQVNAATERVRVLEEAQQKFFESQNQTVKTLLAGTVESNTPVAWPEREQVKMNATPPRSVMATIKDRAIKQALVAQIKQALAAKKKLDVVQ